MVNPLIPLDGVWAISANKLNIALACPRKLCYYLSHVEGDDTDTRYIDSGQAVHQYMEDNFNGNPQSMEYYLDKFDVLPEMFNRVETCIENAQPYLSLKGTPEVAEETLFDTPKGRKVKLISRIDLQCEDADIEGANKNLVIDWKTGSKINKEEYIVQMQVYRFVKNFEYDAMLVSLLTGEKLIVNKSPKNYIPNLCDRYIDMIENLDFEPKPNPNCTKYCPYYTGHCSEEHKYDLVVPRMTWDDENKRWIE